jgi:hypothetical protein
MSIELFCWMVITVWALIWAASFVVLFVSPVARYRWEMGGRGFKYGLIDVFAILAVIYLMWGA